MLTVLEEEFGEEEALWEDGPVIGDEVISEGTLK